ncbi:MAG: di-heme oxidoredictase family protein [Phycisphaerales bacterium]|nr:di-heme oxidoredictase family protein [Phycisphaerales bacterium]
MHRMYSFALLFSMPSITEAATPDYQGTACPMEGGVLLEVEVAEDTTLMLVYPTPPGGGWTMTEEAPGRFTHLIPGLSPGDDLSFNLLIQNPVQYVFPSHDFMVGEDCTAFERDDVTPPPPRGFRHVITLSETGATIQFESGANGTYLGDTTSVRMNYRIDQGPLATIEMQEGDPGKWEAVLPGAEAGQSLTYWFSQQLGSQPQDTALLKAILGQANSEPDWPVITKRSGRFRHRHPNEWRFDNYVEDYGVGKTFEMIFTDWGQRVEIELAIDEDLPVNRVDFRYFAWNDPFSDYCNRPETLINQIMTGSQNHFTHLVEDVTPGTIIDFDLTFIDLPTPGLQYYSEFFYYRVGQGHFGPHKSNPRMTPVGPATESHVYSPRFGFAQHASTLALDELKAFMDGKVFFETDYENADLLNLGTHFTCCAGPLGQNIVESPAFKPGVIGPRYAAASCIQCHSMDGRGPTPYPNQDLFGLVAQVSIPGQGAFGEPLPHPFYGNQLDVLAEDGTAIEGRMQVEYEEINGTFDDGTPYVLRKPAYRFMNLAYGALGTNLPDQEGSQGYPGIAEFSPRIAPILPGLGMLEAISEDTILAGEDPNDSNGDGISGRANRVWDQQAQKTVVGRFGWKANQPNLEQQASDAFRMDLGITTPLNTQEDCGAQQPDCETGDGLPELQHDELDLVTAYLRGLTLPPRHNYEDPMAISGMHLFKKANCHGCHTPVLQTGSSHPIPAFHDIAIEPFTDLLLHDMGPELADGRPHFEAGENEWRTPPLWALTHVRHALGLPETCEDPNSGGTTPNFLHDGRARSLMEAILWHGGEAEASRNVVLAMNAIEREELLAYVAYPFADPIFQEDGETQPGCPSDLDNSGVVDVIDVLMMLDAWGQAGPGDLDQDGTVGTNDILILLADYGQAC